LDLPLTKGACRRAHLLGPSNLLPLPSRAWCGFGAPCGQSRIDRRRELRDIDVGVAQHHPLGLPASELHERDQVAVGRVVPRRLGVAAIVRAEIGYSGTPARAFERRLDLATPRRFFRIRKPRRRAEYTPLLVPKGAQFIDQPGMQRHAALIAVLGIEERHMRSRKIDIAPVEVKRLRHPRAGPQQEHHQRPQMAGARREQRLGLVERDPAHPPLGLLRALDDALGTQPTLGRVVEHGRNRREGLAIEGGWGRRWMQRAGRLLDHRLVDLGQRDRSNPRDNRLEVQFLASRLQVTYGRPEECCGRLSAKDTTLDDFPLPLRPDCFRGFSVSNSCALAYSDASDRSVDIPVRPAWSPLELEGHFRAS
jgi:hypothetical protein